MRASNSFQMPKSINPQQVMPQRRRSSWSVMKNILKGVNGLMHPQVMFIKNEVLSRIKTKNFFIIE